MDKTKTNIKGHTEKKHIQNTKNTKKIKKYLN